MTELVGFASTSGRYLHWSVVSISVTNAIVIGVMVLVFVLAILTPFPRWRSRP